MVRDNKCVSWRLELDTLLEHPSKLQPAQALPGRTSRSSKLQISSSESSCNARMPSPAPKVNSYRPQHGVSLAIQVDIPCWSLSVGDSLLNTSKKLSLCGGSLIFWPNGHICIFCILPRLSLCCCSRIWSTAQFLKVYRRNV